MERLKNSLWVARRVLLEGVVCVSVLYLFLLTAGFHQGWDAGGVMAGIKAVFFFTEGKAFGMTKYFYATWTFHWFYFWIRMGDRIERDSAENVFWGSAWALGAIILIWLSSPFIHNGLYHRVLDKAVWPFLSFFICFTFLPLLSANLYFWIGHYSKKAPWVKKPVYTALYPDPRYETRLSRMLDFLSFKVKQKPAREVEPSPVFCIRCGHDQNQKYIPPPDPVPENTNKERMLI